MENAPAVYAAICAVTHDLSRDGIGKDRRNQAQGFNFRGIDDVFNALSPSLARHKLAMLPRVLTRTETERQSAKGGALYSVVVDVEFDLVSGVDGSRHTIRAIGEAMDSADKATNKAMSAAYKYAAFMAFCIPVEGTDDADAHSPDPLPTHRAEPQRTQRQPDERRAQVAPGERVADKPGTSDPRASLAAVGWDADALACLTEPPTTRDAMAELYRRAKAGWRPDADSAEAKADPVLTLVRRRLSRVRDARAAGVYGAIVEDHGQPGRWDHAACDRIKARIASAGGGA